jgi:hypothetical protein
VVIGCARIRIFSASLHLLSFLSYLIWPKSLIFKVAANSGIQTLSSVQSGENSLVKMVCVKRFGEESQFIFVTSSTPVSGPTQPLIQWVPGVLSPELKRLRREADHQPPSSTEINSTWSYTFTRHSFSRCGAS